MGDIWYFVHHPSKHGGDVFPCLPPNDAHALNCAHFCVWCCAIERLKCQELTDMPPSLKVDAYQNAHIIFQTLNSKLAAFSFSLDDTPQWHSWRAFLTNIRSQALPFEAREIDRAPLRAWIALWKRDLLSALNSAELSFLKSIFICTDLVNQPVCSIAYKKLDLKRRLWVEQFSYQRCSRSEIVLKYKEKTVIFKYVTFPTIQIAPLVYSRRAFPVALLSLLSKAPEELHIEPLQISNGSPWKYVSWLWNALEVEIFSTHGVGHCPWDTVTFWYRSRSDRRSWPQKCKMRMRESDVDEKMLCLPVGLWIILLSWWETNSFSKKLAPGAWPWQPTKYTALSGGASIQILSKGGWARTFGGGGKK